MNASVVTVVLYLAVQFVLTVRRDLKDRMQEVSVGASPSAVLAKFIDCRRDTARDCGMYQSVFEKSMRSHLACACHVSRGGEVVGFELIRYQGSSV